MVSVEIAGNKYDFTRGTTLEEIIERVEPEDKEIIVAGIINNQLCDLTTPVRDDCKLKFLTINDEFGNRIYRRSLFLVLVRAIYELFPGAQLSIEHSISNGIYCELHKDSPLTQRDLSRIEFKMYELINADLPITGKELPVEEVKEIFSRQGFLDKVKLLNQLEITTCPVYELDGVYDYFYFNMVPRTGYLKRFDLHYRMPGFILLYPQKGNPYQVPEFIEQPKLASIFHEYEKWGDIIGVGNVSELNRMIAEGRVGELVRISEALHEKKIANIADKISDNIEKKRIILIAGPSSSGKTTFAQRLAIQLRVNGLRPVAISTDDRATSKS